MIWRFSYIIAWVLIAAVLSFMGQPLVRLFDRIHIKKLRIPHFLSALLSLIVIVIVIPGIDSCFCPSHYKSGRDNISRIDVDQLAQNLQGPLQWIDEKLHMLGAIPAGQTIQDFLVDKAKTVVNLGSVGSASGQFHKCCRKYIYRIVLNTFYSFLFSERR